MRAHQFPKICFIRSHRCKNSGRSIDLAHPGSYWSSLFKANRCQRHSFAVASAPQWSHRKFTFYAECFRAAAFEKTLVVYSAFAKAIGNGIGMRDQKDFNVLLVGRLAHWKGQHIVLEAAKSFKNEPRVKFWLAGDALFGEEAYKQELLQKIKTTSLLM